MLDGHHNRDRNGMLPTRMRRWPRVPRAPGSARLPLSLDAIRRRGLMTDLQREPRGPSGDSSSSTSSTRTSGLRPSPSPAFSRLPTAPTSLGSVRRAWRPLLASLGAFPALQEAVVATASYFTRPEEIDFALPRDFAARYRLGEVLGEGAFGRVHRALPVAASASALELDDLAVKVIPKARVVNLRDYEALQQEGRMMVLLGGTLNVVHFFGAYEDDVNVYLVMEHCTGGDAFTRLVAADDRREGHDHRPHAPNEPLAALYMADILHVVWQCHLVRILHGDLKLENFLFADRDPHAPLKLTDFGGAAFIPEDHHHGRHPPLVELRGTPLYTAPEVLAPPPEGYGFPADLWSCGIILYRLLAGRFPFEAGALLDERILHADLDWNAPPWPDVSPGARDLVRGLLERDPGRRLTAEAALQHPWLQTAATHGSAAHAAAVGPRPGRPGAPVTTTVGPWLDGTVVQRLQLYRSLNSFQQAVFTEIARRLPVEAKEDVVVLFSDLPRDGHRDIGAEELAAHLARGGYRLTRAEARGLFARMDIDGDGRVSLDEFAAALLDWSVLQRRDPAQWDAIVLEVFGALDADGDGLLTLADLAVLAPFAPRDEGGVGTTTTTTRKTMRAAHSFRSDMRRCFRHADLDGNGVIDRHEFRSMLHIQLRAYEHFARRLLPPHAPSETR